MKCPICGGKGEFEPVPYPAPRLIEELAKIEYKIGNWKLSTNAAERKAYLEMMEKIKGCIRLKIKTLKHYEDYLKHLDEATENFKIYLLTKQNNETRTDTL